MNLCIGMHQILNRYRDSLETRSKHNDDKGEILPTNVILVGHSMGGFVARAAVVHPELRPGSVKTIVTLSSPHRYAVRFMYIDVLSSASICRLLYLVICNLYM